jgi:DNA-binding HxlR family transcriptional regulator
MALPREYQEESCPIARSLEIIGGRWTLLIVRDAFYGVRRFSDFSAHLGIPKAVLSDRLAFLVAQGIMAKAPAAGGRDEYLLTDTGLTLWPTLWSLITWGNENHIKQPLRRASYYHADCGGMIQPDGACARCGQSPGTGNLVWHPPRRSQPRRSDAISQALSRPHRLLEPICRNAVTNSLHPET